MESRLHITSDSSRLEFLYYLAIEHQNIVLLIMLSLIWWTVGVALFQDNFLLLAVCAESDVKSDGKLHGGLEMRLQFLCYVSP